MRSAVAGVAILSACAAPFDTDRTSTEPDGTFGDHVVTLMCKRLAYEADPSDVSGNAYRDTCNGGSADPTAPPTVLALVGDRERLVAAIDAAVPPDQTGPLQAYMTSNAVLGLYDDGTMSAAVLSLGQMLQQFAAAPDAMLALSRMGVREGYRPPAQAIGPAGTLLNAQSITSVLDHVLPLIDTDGAANAQWNEVVTAMAATLADAAAPADAASPTRTAAIVDDFLLATYPELAEATPVPMVMRDPRGIASVALVGGQIPPPFVDADHDSLADVNAQGQFVDATGTPIAASSPFPTTGDTATRDALGRALDGSGSPIYNYVDVTQTLLGALSLDAEQLTGPANGTAPNLLLGASLLLGDRAAQTKTFDDGATLTYSGYDTANSPLLDMAYAYAQLLLDPNTDDTLALAEQLFGAHQSATARLVEDAIVAARTGDAHPEAQILADAPFWDDMRPLVQQILADPQLVANLLTALQQPEVEQVIQRFSDYMSYDDQFDIDPTTQAVTGAFTTHPDRTQPDNGYNRSLWQRLIHLISDTNGATQCNKQGAVVRDPTTGLPLETYNACALFQIPNLAVFYLQSMVYAKDGSGNIVCESNAGAFAATKTATTAAGCAAFGTGWRPQPKANFNYNWGTVVSTLITVEGGDAFLESDTTITGLRTHPTPQGLNRAQFLEPMPSALADLIDPITDKFGNLLTTTHAGTLPVWEVNDFYDEVRPIVQAFADANQEQTFVDILSVMHKHWSSMASTTTQHTNPSGAEYTFGSNLVSWEPLVIDVFGQDLWPALCETSAELTAITVDSKPFSQVVAHAGDFVMSPLSGLANRAGATTSTTSDGQPVTTLSPWQLLADAYDEKHAQLAAAGPSAALWTNSISQLVDILFRAQADSTGAWHFTNAHVAATTRGVVSLLAGRVDAHVADRAAWCGQVVTQDAQDLLTHPLFAALADFIAALTTDGAGITALETLLAEVLDPTNAAAFDTMRIGTFDLAQLAYDDADLVPLAHDAASVLAPGQTYLPTQVAFLDRLHQADTAKTLNGVIARLFSPYAATEPGIPALSAIVDSVGDVDRVAPSTIDLWSPDDYTGAFTGTGGFLQEQQHGLPRFIQIVAGRNL
jgi:hypothetical protein